MNARRWLFGGAGGLGRRARTEGRHAPLGRSLPRASGCGPLPCFKLYCSAARAACWKRRQAATWSETTFPCDLLTWTSNFARDDDAQQERRNGFFFAIVTVMSLFPSLCVSLCLAAVRGAWASRGKRQAGLLFVCPPTALVAPCDATVHRPTGLVPRAGTRRWGVLCRGYLDVGLCHVLSYTALQHAQRAEKEGRRRLGVKRARPPHASLTQRAGSSTRRPSPPSSRTAATPSSRDQRRRAGDARCDRTPLVRRAAGRSHATGLSQTSRSATGSPPLTAPRSIIAGRWIWLRVNRRSRRSE